MFKKLILNIKYLKNNCDIKYKIIKNKKKNGYNVSFKDILLEYGVLKNTTSNIKKNPNIKNNQTYDKNIDKNKNKINKAKEKYIEYIFNKESVITIGVSLVVTISCFLLASNIFYEKININYYELTSENESKILNTLKSPKTNTDIKAYFNEDKKQIDYYLQVNDRLDSYSYKLNINSLSDTLHDELLNNALKNTVEINSLNEVQPKTIMLYKDKYIINNKYNIDNNLIDNNTLDKINEKILIENLELHKSNKYIYISLICLSLSTLLNSIYFALKKVISKK